MAETPTINTPHPNAVVTCHIALGEDAHELDSAVNILAILVQREVNRIPFARIRIKDGSAATSDFALSDTDTFLPGTKIQVSLGYSSDDVRVFKGIITSVSERVTRRGSEMILEARDEAVKMTLTPRNKHFNDITDSDLATQLIENYGLTAEVESSAVSHQNLVQYNTSDWDFLVSRMDRLGKIILASDGMITAREPDLSSASVLDLEFGDNILEFNATIDARTQVKDVSVSSWNPGSQDMESSDAEVSGNTGGNLSPDDLAGALGIGMVDLRSAASLGAEERQGIANARKLKNVLAKIRGKVKFFGHSEVHAGDVLNLKGLGDRFNGPAFVGGVTHEYAEGGWTTEAILGLSPEWFSHHVSGAVASGMLTPAGPAPAGTATANGGTGLISMVRGLQIGLVTDIVDPDTEFRVKVKLVSVSADEDGVWARVSTLDAGDTRGTFFRPEVGDEVIVGFIQDDPSFPVILGMMHSSALASPIAPASDNNEKGYQSREGLKLNFNDGDKSVTIETPTGKKMTLSESDGVIRMEDENNNILKFESSGITLQSGKDLTIQATGTLSLSGASISMSANADLGLSGTSVSVSGTGSTEIKGALVKIN